MPPPRLTCVFCSAATVGALLGSPQGRPLAGDLLVECATYPFLGFTLGVETPAGYPGLAGLLGGNDLGSLAHATDRLPAPVILAPGAPVGPAALRSALARLRRADDRVKHITLLVPFAEARALGAALGVADRFAVAWDISELPHAELLEFARWLADEPLFEPAAFAGVFAYASEPLDPAHVQRLVPLLAPLAVPGAPSGLIPAAR